MLSQKYPSYVKNAIEFKLLKGYTLPLTSVMMISLIAPFNKNTSFAYLYKDYKDRKKGNGLSYWADSFNLNTSHPIISNVTRYTIGNMSSITNRIYMYLNPTTKNFPSNHYCEWHEQDNFKYLISLIKQKNLMLVI